MPSEDIVLVDDSPQVRLLLTTLLREDGYRVTTFEDGREVVSEACASPPDMFLLDIDLPGMDGFELCRTIKAVDALREIPVLFVSALDETADKVRAFGAGAVDYVTKPVQIDELRARMRAHLDLRRRERELRDSYRDVLAAKARVEALAAELEVYNRFVRKTFGRYLSDDIVTRLLESPEGLDFEGHSGQVSVLIADLRGFTALVERVAARDVVALLNLFLDAMAEVVAAHGGTIGDFVGDAVMVIFGAPLPCPHHARVALECAVEMQNALPAMNRRGASLGLPAVEMGIGVASGEVVVGNVGSLKHAKYGVVGLPVNIAARVQSYAIGGQILATEATVKAAGEGVGVGARMRVEAKGVTDPLMLFSIERMEGQGRLLLRQAPLRPLVPPRPVRAWPVDDKHVGSLGFDTTMVALSDRGAELEWAGHPRCAELKLDLGRGLPPLYARITEGGPDRGRVRFTSAPSLDALQALLTAVD